MQLSLSIIHSIEDPSLDRVGGYLLGLDFVFPLITLALTVYLTNDELPIPTLVFGPDPTHYTNQRRTFIVYITGPGPLEIRVSQLGIERRANNSN